jgi:hypothetical protein
VLSGFVTLFSNPLTGDGGPTLSVLTALTHLEHLELPMDVQNILMSPADYAALTASPQLTHLDLSGCFGPEHVADAFPQNLRMSKLASLTVFIDWLEETDTIQRIVDSCPGLEQLRIEGHGGHDIEAVWPEKWAASLACLMDLSSLTRLHMSALGVRMSTGVFSALALLTGLRELHIDAMNANDLGSAVQLTLCKQLTRLEIGVLAMEQDEGEFCERTANKV